MDETFIDIEYLKQLLELFDSSTANEIRLEKDGVEIRLSKASKASEGSAHTVAYIPAPTPAAAPAPAAPPAPAAHHEAPAPAPAAPASSASTSVITSPIVGTFYRSPDPSADPFVQVGSVVTVGTPLCIVEAMKLMNEIESDVAGEIVEIFVANGQPVEYGQPLFLVKLV